MLVLNFPQKWYSNKANIENLNPTLFQQPNLLIFDALSKLIQVALHDQSHPGLQYALHNTLDDVINYNNQIGLCNSLATYFSSTFSNSNKKILVKSLGLFKKSS